MPSCCPSKLLTVGWLIYVSVLLWALWRAPWVELFTDSRRQHLLFGTVFALFMLWLVRRDFDTGVSYHFIGMTAVTLLLDWPLAIVGALVAQCGLVLLGRQDLAAVGVNGAPADCAAGAGDRMLCDPGPNARSHVIPLCISSFPASSPRRYVLCLLLALWLLWFNERFQRCLTGWKILSVICGC